MIFLLGLGVPITVRGEMRIVSRTRTRGEPPARYCAIADIDYAAVDGPEAAKGILVYVKPCFYGGEPTDIFNYASAHATFPHESTADQFFTEAQFEAYRSLGEHVGDKLFLPAIIGDVANAENPEVEAWFTAIGKSMLDA